MQTDWIRRWIYTGCALFWGTLLCAQQYYISDIQVYGNERTKEHIILRELDLHVGDSVKATRLQHLDALPGHDCEKNSHKWLKPETEYGQQDRCGR